MKIADSSVMMASVRRYSEKTEEKESLQIIVRDPSRESQGDMVSPSGKSTACKCNKMLRDTDPESGYKVAHMLKALVVEVLSGRKIRLANLENLRDKEASPNSGESPASSENQGSGVGLIYNQQSLYQEKEEVSLLSTGIIRTTDGREIDFTLRLDMSREFTASSSLNIRMGDPALTDPLVINFGGRAAELTDTRFAFDLDLDGRDDSMPVLGGGSGYLALDRNGDGFINDGRELFGPSTGNGFEELDAYDEDGNHWIDEGDSVFEKLRIWLVDTQGNEVLEDLKDEDVGAIYLGRLNTGFDRKDSGNRLQGRITDSGLYLKEDGTPGTIQELDLAV